MMPPVGHIIPVQPLPGAAGLPGFPGVCPPQNAAQQKVGSSLYLEHFFIASLEVNAFGFLGLKKKISFHLQAIDGTAFNL